MWKNLCRFVNIFQEKKIKKMKKYFMLGYTPKSHVRTSKFIL